MKKQWMNSQEFNFMEDRKVFYVDIDTGNMTDEEIVQRLTAACDEQPEV